MQVGLIVALPHLAGKLPIHCAAFNGHAAAVRLLLAAAPCTAQCTSYAGLTPLRCVVWQGRQLSLGLL